ncbi:MAG: hypothetical protein R2795_11425 [Saprospiraceae bacterium]
MQKKEVSGLPHLRAYAAAQQLPILAELPDDLFTLAQAPDDPFGPRRGTDIAQYSDGSITATSYKAFNILKLTQTRFQLSVLKLLPAGAVVLVPGNPLLTTILALLSFLYAFVEAGKKEFEEQDARVLLSIYKLGSHCHFSTLPAMHQQLFGETISEEALRASIELLASYRTVRLHSNGEVEIKESIQLSRQ